MIVQIIIDSVAPAFAAVIAFKKLFHHGGSIKRTRQLDHVPINDYRPTWMVWSAAVITKAKHATLGLAQQSSKLVGRESLPTSETLSRFFQVFQQYQLPAISPASFATSRISGALSTTASMHLFRRCGGLAWRRTGDRSARRDRQNHVFNRSTRGPVGAFAEMSGQALPHNPSSFFALPPASAATVAALKSSTAAM